MKRRTKQRGIERRIAFALQLLRGGFPLEEAARRACISQERLQRALGNEQGKQLMEGDDMTEQDHNTELGTEGVPYRSEAAEELIAERMMRLSASGRPAGREGVIRELVNKGAIQTALPREQIRAALDAELMASLTPEQRTKLPASPSQGAGRSLGESMAIATAAKIGTRQYNAHQPSTERVIELSEEESEREERIEAITSQGYTRAHAEHVLEFNEREGRG